MISLGLSAADQEKFELSLVTGYNLKIVIQILDLNHKYITDVSSTFIDGQVNYTYLELIGSSASMTLLDPDNLVGFDTDSPSDNALYADRMIRIVYCVYSELLPKWVDVPIFCGPVTKVARDDAVVSVECQGKESLVSEPALAWTAKTYTKGWKVTSAIRDVMANKAGETKFELPEFSTTLGKDFTLAGETVIWPFVKEMAGKARQLFYDGRGVLKLRDNPSRPIWTFDEATMLSVPKLDYNHGEIRNGVRVIGATNTLRAYRYLSNESSPSKLGRINSSGTTVKRHLMELVEDTSFTTQAAVNAEANRLLGILGVTNVGFDFDSFPIPHLEPGDIFHLTTRETSLILRLKAYSIPLRAGAQTNGSIKKISANRARLRR
jgi:hypothetical protein